MNYAETQQLYITRVNILLYIITEKKHSLGLNISSFVCVVISIGMNDT